MNSFPLFFVFFCGAIRGVAGTARAGEAVRLTAPSSPVKPEARAEAPEPEPSIVRAAA